MPEQYQICLRALDTILKNSYDIYLKSNDPSEKMQAMELYKDVHLEKLELLSNAQAIDHALQFIKSKQREVEGKQEHASQEEKQCNETSTPITTNNEK